MAVHYWLVSPGRRQSVVLISAGREMWMYTVIGPVLVHWAMTRMVVEAEMCSSLLD